MVEHDLAKVGVASSSLVFRSREVIRNGDLFPFVSTGLILLIVFVISIPLHITYLCGYKNQREMTKEEVQELIRSDESYRIE